MKYSVLYSEFNFYIFSIGFYQMTKIAVTPSIVLAEFVLYRKRVSMAKVNALILPVNVYLIIVNRDIYNHWALWSSRINNLHMQCAHFVL